MAAAVVWLGGASVARGHQGSPDGADARLAADRSLEEVLRAHTDRILAIPGVVGVGEGRCDGQPCIKVFVARKTPDLLKEIPPSLDGYPVAVEETGELRPFTPPPPR
jgi:hypothetical protein